MCRSITTRPNFLIMVNLMRGAQTSFFEKDAIERLRNLLVKQFEKCNTCFAKWNCAGDCASYRLFQETTHGSSKVPMRCRINRALLREQLILRAKERG